MRTRSAVGVLLALLLAGSTLVMAEPAKAASAQTPTNAVPGCDGVIAVPGGYQLTRDTDCAWGLNSGTDIDLGGHTFTGRFDTSPFGVGGKVHNGTLRLRGGATWGGRDRTFSSVRIQPAPDTPPRHWFITVGPGFTLENSVVEDVPGAAFDLYSGGNGAAFRNSVFRNNGVPFAIQKSSDVVIEGNWFIDNGTGVLMWPEDGNHVNGNVIRRNIFVGNSVSIRMHAGCNTSGCFYITGRVPALDRTVIEHNLIVNSRYPGISISIRCEVSSSVRTCVTATGNEIRGNIILGSGHDPSGAPPFDDGITARGTSRAGSPSQHVDSPYPEALAGFLLSGNLAVHNTDLGFDVLGVTDGGRNLAFANGNPDQCDGVRCTLGRPPHRDLAGAPLSSPDDIMPLHPHPETEAESDLAS